MHHPFECFLSFAYGSKNGYGSLCGDPDVWNEGGMQNYANDLKFQMNSVSLEGYGSGVWIACASGVWTGTLHSVLQPFQHMVITSP
jgi:hypothetical protein